MFSLSCFSSACAVSLQYCVALQGRAKNEATFRTPDQDGWQPKKEKIDPEECLGARLSTDLPLEDISGNPQCTFPRAPDVA